MRISNLPDDLLIYILVRLPLECLGQLKSIAKSWNALISSQKFIKFNLNQSRIGQKPNVLVPEFEQIQMVEFSITGENMDLYKDFHYNFKRLHCLPELLDERVIVQMVGSSNGLLCLLLSPKHETVCSLDRHDSCCFFHEYNFALCNPLTKSTWDLPGNQWKRLFSDKSLYGFWYDDVNDDYKVVIVNDVFEKGGIHEYECEIYSLMSNSWSKVSSYLDFSYEYKVPLHGADGALVNCALYWVIWDDQRILSFILAFDLKTYTHKILPKPRDLDGINRLKLTVLNGSLVLSNGCQHSYLYDLWVMKDYGLNDSWMRITINKSYPGCSFTPLALLEDNDKRILVSSDDWEYMLELNDLVSHQDQSIHVQKPCGFHNARQLQFVGSLVQPYPPSVGYEKISSEDDLRNFENFHVHVNGVSVDSQLPEHVRRKYYDLCCSKKSLLHERFVPGVYPKLAARMIIEAVSIADSIRRCKFTTSKNEFERWGKSLRSFELLGMNIGFLRDRIRWLLSLAFDSEEAIEAKKYWEVKTEWAYIEDEIEDLEIKLAELKEASEQYGAEVDTLKPKAKRYKVMFQEEVNAPW